MATSASALHSTHCCSRPLVVEGPVDRILSPAVRLREIPGTICLECRNITVPEILPSRSLENAIVDCLNGDPSTISILKTRPLKDQSLPGICQSCQKPTEPLLLDVGIGEYAGLVVEGLPGSGCRMCATVTLFGGGDALRPHLTQFDANAPGKLMPSLVYNTPAHPRSVQLEVTTRCNLKCDYCSHRHLPVKADLPLEDFRQYLDQIDFNQVDNVDFTGLGEPVMHPDLPAMIAEVKRRGSPSQIRVVTNGTILNSRRIADLCNAGITSIAFSIDSLDARRFALARGGANLQHVLRNLETLVQYRAAQNLTNLQIKIKAVLVDEPYVEAESLLAYSAKLGIEMPHFSCLDSRQTALQLYEQSWLQNDWAREGGSAFTMWAAARWRELTGLAADQPVVKTSKKSAEYVSTQLGPDTSLCRWAVDATFVSSTGESLSCCEQMIDIPRTYWGSLRTKSLAELWAGDLLWGYRLPLSLGRVPSACIGCPWAPVNGIPLVTNRQSDRTSQPA